MAERRRPLLLAALAGIAAAAVIILAVKALTADDSAEACQAPQAAPAEETALMPQGLSFDEIGTVTSVRKDGENVNVEAVTSKPLDEFTVSIQDAVTAAGYSPAGADNEGDEAEVFFTKGSLAAGQARLEESDCEGQWDIDLVLVEQES
jgi:hypothetical protein